MAEAFETIIQGKTNIVLLGEAGCGKSELAMNLAVELAKTRAVDFFDMDQTKPLFRSRDARRALEENGVAFHYEEQFFDAPTMVGGVSASLGDVRRTTILDVGGNDTGARLIGGFAGFLNREDAIVLYVVNPYRPWSGSVEDIDGTLSAILRVSHLKKFHVIANPNLGHETTAEEFAAGIEKAKQMLDKFVPVEGAAVRQDIYGAAAEKTQLPLLSVKLYLQYDWSEN